MLKRGRFVCYVCGRDAAIRIFSGTYGGGFAACDEHANRAATDAIEPLLKYSNLVENYRVVAYAVVYDSNLDALRLDRKLWVASRKAA